MTGNDQIRHREARALVLAMWGNLFMAAAGVLAGFLSNSNAIIMDGLFSLVGFVSALMARRISARLGSGPDRLRPWGYAADEAIFVTFRSLILLGLVASALVSAAFNITGYLRGDMPPKLNFAPMLVYFVVIGVTCAGLWWVSHHAWIRSGRKSDILRLESRAAAFDGAITGAAGLGLGLVYAFGDGVLAPIAPIGDSLIVVALCLLAVGQYVAGFRGGLAELAGVTAPPAAIAAARRALRPALAEDGGELIDFSVSKIGRSHLITCYYNPRRPASAAEIDRLNLRLLADIAPVLPHSDVLLLVTGYGRRWPADLWPGEADPS
ncbi:MAG: cation transporter [Paracoccus sp. (in: a-proteobacteria)]|nr:cation transporter [Paracoccus sp. (in: a-proteobacteria)]